MKFVLICHLIITLGLSLILVYFNTMHHAYSFIAGAGVIFLSFFMFWMVWKLVSKKKLVALAIGIIVFKYAILGIIIFRLIKQPWLSPLWFSLGVAVFSLAAVAYAIKESLLEGKIDGVV